MSSLKTHDTQALDALTGGAFSAPTSGERAARVREWLAKEPSPEQMHEVFRELSARDKGAARPLREKLDEIKRAKGQEAIATEWAEKGRALLAQPRLNIADALAWQRDAAKAGAPLSREPLAGVKTQLAERVKGIEDLQNRVQVQREAAVLLAQRIEVLSTKSWKDAQVAAEALRADVPQWQAQAQALLDDANWGSVDPKFPPLLEASRGQLQLVWDAFQTALAQATAAADDAQAPLPPVPVWADELRQARGLAVEAAPPKPPKPRIDPELRAKANQAVTEALGRLEQEVGQGHGKASAGAANALRKALQEHGKLVDDKLEAQAHAALGAATELEGWQRWRADQLRQELVAKAEGLFEIVPVPGSPAPAATVRGRAAGRKDAIAAGTDAGSPAARGGRGGAAAGAETAAGDRKRGVADAQAVAGEGRHGAGEAQAAAGEAQGAAGESPGAAGDTQSGASEAPVSAVEPQAAAVEPQATDAQAGAADAQAGVGAGAGDTQAAAVETNATPSGQDATATASEDAAGGAADAAGTEAAAGGSRHAATGEAQGTGTGASQAVASRQAHGGSPSGPEQAVATVRRPRYGGRKMQETLRTLREQWKQVDQGGPPNHALWKRFDEACNEAYKVVQEWLDKVKSEAAEHRAARLALIQEVKAWAAAHPQPDHGDWKAFNRAIHQFSDRWREAGHLSEKAFAELQPQWKEAISLAAGPLEQAQRESVERRNAMIEEAKALGEAPMLRIDAVKSLQQRWQAEAQAVPVDRKQEQKLWDAFRKPIDDAFNRKTVEREKAAASMSARDRAVLDASRAVEEATASGDAQKIRTAMAALEQALRGGAAEPAHAAAKPAAGAVAPPAADGAAAAEGAGEGTDAGADGGGGEGAGETAPAPAKPAAKPVIAMRGDDRPGAKRPELATAARPGGRFDPRRPGPGGRDARDDRRGGMRGERGDRGERDDRREDRGPRLGDAAFRAQRDAQEHAQFALRKLAAQAHGEALTQLVTAWEKRAGEQVPSHQELGKVVSPQVRQGWIQALGQAPGGDPSEALLRLEIAADVPTPGEQISARRMLQLQLLTKRNEAGPQETWGADVAKVLATGYEAGAARRLQNALKVLLRR